jgi:hypothetical protein
MIGFSACAMAFAIYFLPAIGNNFQKQSAAWIFTNRECFKSGALNASLMSFAFLPFPFS